jgi:hypothetical protein
MLQPLCLNDNTQELAQALTMLKQSLELLDASNAPADIGGHLDLAICRLEDHVVRAGCLSDAETAKS